MEKVLRVRDTRKPGHCWADNEIISVYGPKLGPYGVSVYMVMSLVARNGTGECKITVRQIAGLLAISPSTVAKAVDNLISLQLVARDHKGNGDGQPSVYALLDVEKMTRNQTVAFFGTLNPVRMENRGGCSCGGEPCSCGEQGQVNPVRVANTNNTDKTIKTNPLSDESDGVLPGFEGSPEEKKETKPGPASRLRSFEDELKRHTKDPWELEKLPKIWAYYCEKTDRGAMYMGTEKRVRAGLARMRDAVKVMVDPEKLAETRLNVLRAFKMAIDNLAADEFLSGQNDRNTEYRDWYDHLMKNWETFEKRMRSGGRA